MKGIIYCIERIKTGKKYIGQHLGTIDDDYWGSGVAISKAIKKYGRDEFKKYTLEECNIENLNDREQYWIKHYNTFLGEGYNMDNGGACNSGYWANLSDEKKAEIHSKRLANRPKNFKQIMHQTHTYRDNRAISKKLKGRTYSKETIQKMSDAAMGRKLTDEAKAKISKANLGKTLTPQQCANISKNTKGKPKSFRTEEHKQKLRKPVKQLDLNGNFIKLWEAVSFAGNELNIDYTSISKVCNGKAKTAGGYKWEWDK